MKITPRINPKMAVTVKLTINAVLYLKTAASGPVMFTVSFWIVVVVVLVVIVAVVFVVVDVVVVSVHLTSVYKVPFASTTSR